MYCNSAGDRLGQHGVSKCPEKAHFDQILIAIRHCGDETTRPVQYPEALRAFPCLALAERTSAAADARDCGRHVHPTMRTISAHRLLRCAASRPYRIAAVGAGLSVAADLPATFAALD